jgi:hypothetical protein
MQDDVQNMRKERNKRRNCTIIGLLDRRDEGKTIIPDVGNSLPVDKV